MDRPIKQSTKPPPPLARAAPGGNTTKDHPPPSSSSKRPRWTTSTFGPTTPALDKGKGRADGSGSRTAGSRSDRSSRVAPPSFALPAPAKPASATKVKPVTTRARVPPLTLEGPLGDGDQQRAKKKPRTSTGSALDHLPLPLAAPPPPILVDPAGESLCPSTTPGRAPQKQTRPLPVAPFIGGPSKSTTTPKSTPARRTVALSSVVPPSAQTTPVHPPKKPRVASGKVEHGIRRGLLDIPQAKESMKIEDDVVSSAGLSGKGGAASAVKVEEALMGVSPRKPRRTTGTRGGNLSTAASLLLTSHHTALTRFYQALLAQRDALPSADIELHIVSLPSSPNGSSSSPPTPKKLFPFQKTSAPVKRVLAICAFNPPSSVVLVPSLSAATPSPTSTSDREGGLAERVHVLLRLDEHSTSLPPAVSRWAKLRVGQRVLGWRPWVELGQTTAIHAEGIGERILGLERFIVLE